MCEKRSKQCSELLHLTRNLSKHQNFPSGSEIIQSTSVYRIFVHAMDVINKLYSSVSNTVSQLSSALPGNPITKEFDVGEHIASVGPGTSLFAYSLFKFTRLSCQFLCK